MSDPREPDVAGAKPGSPLLAAKAGDYRYSACTADELKNGHFEQGFCGDKYSPPGGPRDSASVALAHQQNNAPRGYIPITWFGKLHYVSIEVYAKDAEKYHGMHWKEAWLLLNLIEANYDIYYEWAHPSGFFDSFTSKTVYGYNNLKTSVEAWWNQVEKAPKPTDQDYRTLIDRAYTIIERLAKESNQPLEAPKICINGLELEMLRQDINALTRVYLRYVNNAIESAEHITAGLETVESTAFQILNVVPTLTGMDPFREAAYKISVLLMRASARAVGGYTAWGTEDAALREAFGVIKREGAGVIVDVIAGPVGRLLSAVPGLGRIGRKPLTIIVQQVIEFTCWYFKITHENGGKEISEQQWRDQLYERTASLVGCVISELFPVNLGQKARETLVKAVAESIVRELSTGIIYAQKAAKEQGREVMEVFLADLPGILMRIIQGAVVGSIQRRAQQMGQSIEQQRATMGQGPVTTSEAVKIMNETDVSEFVRKGSPSRETIQAIKQARRDRPPVRALTMKEYMEAGWKDSNLDYTTAAAIRRFADNNDLVVIAMDPAETRTRHTDTPEARGATGPKPLACKAKSSNNPKAPAKVCGLVCKPFPEGHPNGPTHKNYEDALGTWNKESAKMFKNGMMVSPDGVVFHPDQLNRWKQLHPEDAAACDEAVKVLADASKKYKYHDLTDSPPANMPADMVQKVERAKALLLKAKVGYYSDLDLVEVVDFANGKRRFMGDLGEEREAVEIARDNRDHMNKTLNIHDYEDPDIPNYYKQLARQGDAAQHGGNNEIVTLTATKKVAPQGVLIPLSSIHMAFPNGELVRLDQKVLEQRGYSYMGLSKAELSMRLDRDIRKEMEKELQKRLGDKYQDFANRAETVKKGYSKGKTKYKFKGKQIKPLEVPQVEQAQKMFNGVVMVDEPGLGRPIKDTAILTSLRCRGLSIRADHIAKANYHGSLAPYQVEQALEKYGTFVGVETYEDAQYNTTVGDDIVIAVSHWKQSIAEAVEALIRTRQALGGMNVDIRVWYEIYTAYRPVSTDWIRDRIGGPDPGIKPAMNDLKESCSCFKPKADERLRAFAVTGFADTYKRPEKYNKVKDPRAIQGLVLTEVWENAKSGDHDYRETNATNGHKILVFPEALINTAEVLSSKDLAIEAIKAKKSR